MKNKQMHGRAQMLSNAVHGDWRYDPGNWRYRSWQLVAIISFIAERVTRR